MDKIKFAGLDRLYLQHKSDIDKIINKVYSSGQVLQGRSVKELEEKISAICHRKYALAVGSCTDALYFSLLSLALWEDSILVNKYTFDASKTSINKIWSNRIEIDMDNNFQIDLDKLEKELDNYQFGGIVFVNLHGQMTNMDRATEICKKYNLKMVEDAAQSFTSSWNGKPAGSWGDISCLSFDPTKICPAFATGGMVLTDDEELYKELKRVHYKNFGSNSQLSTLQAEILLYWLPLLPEWENRRKHIALYYDLGLKEIGDIETPLQIEGSNHIYHKYVIKTKKSEQLQQYLKEKGIETKIHYPGFTGILSLPIYPQMTNEEINIVIDKVKEFYIGF